MPSLNHINPQLGDLYNHTIPKVLKIWETEVNNFTIQIKIYVCSKRQNNTNREHSTTKGKLLTLT